MYRNSIMIDRYPQKHDIPYTDLRMAQQAGELAVQQEPALRIIDGDEASAENISPSVLAEKIRSLAGSLKGAVSEHPHIYGQITTANDLMQIPAEQRTLEQKTDYTLLVKSVHTIGKYFDERERRKYLEVYTTDELFDLAQRLHKFRKKDRPDFNELEERVLACAGNYLHLLGKELPADLIAARKRMEEDVEGRTGMTWGKLIRFSQRACEAMEQYIFAGDEETHRRDYHIAVTDKTDTYPDLSWVYQFIADEFALEVLGTRQTEAQKQSKQNFIDNCDTIVAWLNEVNPFLDHIPANLRIQKPPRPTKRISFGRAESGPEFERVGAAYSIRKTVQDILQRRDGNDARGITKSVNFDARGALNHQLRLVHMVEQLKRQLTEHAQADDSLEEIVPLD